MRSLHSKTVSPTANDVCSKSLRPRVSPSVSSRASSSVLSVLDQPSHEPWVVWTPRLCLRRVRCPSRRESMRHASSPMISASVLTLEMRAGRTHTPPRTRSARAYSAASIASCIATRRLCNACSSSSRRSSMRSINGAFSFKQSSKLSVYACACWSSSKTRISCCSVSSRADESLEHASAKVRACSPSYFCCESVSFREPIRDAIRPSRLSINSRALSFALRAANASLERESGTWSKLTSPWTRALDLGLSSRASYSMSTTTFE
mmetsp:Transcript_32040/g.97750  ORF Transcript_32040/g.97750 Transcript_32040/m.97750 type:complete len:264 (+) Transcript_32040:593-1384(+)